MSAYCERRARRILVAYSTDTCMQKPCWAMHKAQSNAGALTLSIHSAACRYSAPELALSQSGGRTSGHVVADSCTQQLSQALRLQSEVRVSLSRLALFNPKLSFPNNRGASHGRSRSRDAPALDERAAGCSCCGHTARTQGRKVRHLQATPWHWCMASTSNTQFKLQTAASQQRRQPQTQFCPNPHWESK